jgi:hypothetical protein
MKAPRLQYAALAALFATALLYQSRWAEDEAQICAAEMIDRVISAAGGFSAGEPQHDDMTLVIAKAV